MDKLETILNMKKDSNEQRNAIIEYARENNIQIKDVLEELIIAQADREMEQERKIQLKRPIVFED